MCRRSATLVHNHIASTHDGPLSAPGLPAHDARRLLSRFAHLVAGVLPLPLYPHPLRPTSAHNRKWSPTLASKGAKLPFLAESNRPFGKGKACLND